MSYNSIAKIVIPYESFDSFVKEYSSRVDKHNQEREEYLGESGSYDYSYRGTRATNYLKEYAKIVTDNESYYIISFNWVVMNNSLPGADILYKTLDDLLENKYNFIEIGEDGYILNSYGDVYEKVPSIYTISDIQVEDNNIEKETIVSLN